MLRLASIQITNAVVVGDTEGYSAVPSAKRVLCVESVLRTKAARATTTTIIMKASWPRKMRSFDFIVWQIHVN